MQLARDRGARVALPGHDLVAHVVGHEHALGQQVGRDHVGRPAAALARVARERLAVLARRLEQAADAQGHLGGLALVALDDLEVLARVRERRAVDAAERLDQLRDVRAAAGPGLGARDPAQRERDHDERRPHSRPACSAYWRRKISMKFWRCTWYG